MSYNVTSELVTWLQKLQRYKRNALLVPCKPCNPCNSCNPCNDVTLVTNMPLQQVPKLSAMKLSCLVLMVGSLAACAETEEQINKRFAVQPGGKLVVDVDFGSIDVNTNATSEVIVVVLRKVSRRNKSDEEAFLSERPVTFSQDGDTVT